MAARITIGSVFLFSCCLVADGMTTEKPCINKKGFATCRNYGKISCTGPYEAFARQNCAQYCGYCIDPNYTKPPCVDTQKCETYDAEICTNKDYRIWAEDHCRAFCGLCNNTANRLPLTTASPKSTTEGTCENKLDCDLYLDSSCVGIYAPWANANCPMRCGYCDEPEPCFNKISYCNQYSEGICHQEVYKIWARRNCRQYCGLCYNQTNTLNSTDGHIIIAPGGLTTESVHTGTTPPPRTTPGQALGTKQTFIVEGPPSKTPGKCLYKGNNYDLNEKWYDECLYVCECFDTLQNRMICTDRCTHWHISGTVKGCKLVTEPVKCCERLECTAEHS